MTPKSKSITILIADDDPDDRYLAEDALREAHLHNDIRFVRDGEELLDYLYQRGAYAGKDLAPRPGLILLDLNMPRKDGREALEEIKKDSSLCRIPVVVLTTSKAEEDVIRTYELGISGYVTKPVSFAGLVETMQVIGRYWFEIVELPD